MKYLPSILGLLLYLPLIAHGQKTTTLKGTLTVDGGEAFAYKLVFTDSAGRIDGYSYTWLKEENDTKAAITGTIDRRARTLSFRETGIIYNNNFQSTAILCLIQANLAYKFGNSGFTLSGPVASSDAASAACSRGSLQFSTEDVLKALFAAPPPTASAPLPAAPRDSIRAVTQQITTGIEKSIEWHTDTVIIDVWDGGHIDGDMISLEFNGKPVLTKYTLTKDKKQLRLPLPPEGITTLAIIAAGEGSEPPTTANLMLTDGRMQYPIIAYNKIGHDALIRISRAKKQ